MKKIIISFYGESSQRGQLATDLSDELADIPHLKTEIARERTDSQDAGTLLSIALAGPAVVALVKGISGWLLRRNQSAVNIELPDGTRLRIRNMESADVPSAIKALERVIQ